MYFGRQMLFAGPVGPEALDRPLSNFDVIGIPTRNWSSGLFACFQNIVPSCVVSCFCPCIMWGQIVVRAQIPMLIGMKNAFECCRGKSGYALFVDYYLWSYIISFGLIVVLAAVHIESSILRYFLGFVVIVLLGSIIFITGHSVTAFREKYNLPGLALPNCTFWDKFFDTLLVTLCLPCVLSRMARHVFQYERMDPPLGLFLGDPYHLPPLPPLDEEVAGGGTFERPMRADEAGLGIHERQNMQRHTGAAHRQEAIFAQQRQEVFRSTPPPPPVMATVTSINGPGTNTQSTPFVVATPVNR